MRSAESREKQRLRDRKRDPVKHNARCRAWGAANRERRRAINKKWRDANPVKVLALSNKSHADRLNRTPAWADLQKIREIYAQARAMSEMLGEVWHVDHVVPLRGRKVSGLHVHTNLQIMPGIDNQKKINKFEG